MKHMTYWRVGVALMLALLSSVALANGFSVEVALLAPAAVATLEELATEFATKNSEFRTITDELREMHKELKGRYDKDGEITKELKEAIDKAMTNFNGLKEDVNSLEQKLSARVQDEQKTAKTWGEQFIASDSYKSASAGGNAGSKRSTISMEVKQVTSAAAGGLIRSMRETEVVQLQRERRVVRDLLRTVPINTSSVDYAVQTTRTNAAAPVAEGTAKPYSDYAWGSATAVVRTIAHLAKITRQAMDDAPRLVGERAEDRTGRCRRH